MAVFKPGNNAQIDEIIAEADEATDAADSVTLVSELFFVIFFFQAEDGIRDVAVTGVQTCALPISMEQAIKRDPESAFLWREMAQWLARTDQTEPALAAARKAVQLAPEDAGTHLTQIGRASCRERV